MRRLGSEHVRCVVLFGIPFFTRPPSVTLRSCCGALETLKYRADTCAAFNVYELVASGQHPLPTTKPPPIEANRETTLKRSRVNSFRTPW